MKRIKAQAFIIIIFIMLILALLGVFLANLESTYMERSHIYYRRLQGEYLADTGLDRGKELIADSDGNWRPWKPCPTRCAPVCDSCVSPSTCACTYATCKTSYLREYMTIPPGGKKGYYDLYVLEAPDEGLQTGEIKLKVEGGWE